MSSPPPVPRTIKPLKLASENLQIIAATEQDGITRECGTSIPWLELPEVIRAERGIITTNCAATLLQFLEQYLAKDPLWQVRVTVRERTIARFDERIRITKPVIGFFGFMAPKEKGKRRQSHYWQVLDPTVFLDDPKAAMTASELMAWALDLREWCQENGIKTKPTAGGLAGQLLRHPKFYPDARRRIPGATNDKVREALPGNHYELRGSTKERYCADYIDQSSAHHSAALNCPLPDSNLYALGFFQDLAEKPWASLNDIPTEAMGLLWAKIWTPARRQYPINWEKGATVEEYRPRWAAEAGWKYAFIYTNEIDYLHSIGGRIEHVSAAWLSNHIDAGLPAYARWSLDQTAMATPLRKDWLKKTLLTTYGLLATKPSNFEVGWKQAKGGETRTYFIGAEPMEYQVRRTSKLVHPRIAHVVQRGMIEAETRIKSLRLANDLLEAGEHVLCIYGDGILVRTLPWRSKQRELLPAPWRIKDRVTSLQFINEQSFKSREITRLPGIPAASREKDLPEVLTVA